MIEHVLSLRASFLRLWTRIGRAGVRRRGTCTCTYRQAHRRFFQIKEMAFQRHAPFESARRTLCCDKNESERTTGRGDRVVNVRVVMWVSDQLCLIFFERTAFPTEQIVDPSLLQSCAWYYVVGFAYGTVEREISCEMCLKITCFKKWHSWTFLTNHWEIYKSKHTKSITNTYSRRVYEKNSGAHSASMKSLTPTFKWSLYESKTSRRQKQTAVRQRSCSEKKGNVKRESRE